MIGLYEPIGTSVSKRVDSMDEAKLVDRCVYTPSPVHTMNILFSVPLPDHDALLYSLSKIASELYLMAEFSTRVCPKVFTSLQKVNIIGRPYKSTAITFWIVLTYMLVLSSYESETCYGKT